jgi:hypothetical protein
VRKIASADAIGQKWGIRAPAASDDFKKAVSDSTVTWAGPTAASAASWAAGTQDAISNGRFAKGVNRVTDEKWRRKVTGPGVDRWAPGVRAAVPDFVTAFTPVRDVIERTQAALPPRKPRGDPGNNERQAVMSKALSDFRRHKG